MAKSKIIGFYHPSRQRLQYTGELTDPKTGEVFKPPSMTKQEFKRECDINNIIRDFQPGGMFTHTNAQANQGAYLNLPDDVDYQNSLNIVAQAQKSFMTLPSKVRDRFDNNPAAFLAFMDNPANLEESYTLGLRVKPRAEAPPPAPAPAPTPEPPKA